MLKCSSGNQIQYERMVWLNLEDLRFSWWRCWRLKSSGMWCHIIAPVVADVLKDCTVFIFRFLQYKNSHLRGKMWVSPTTSSDWLATVSSHPVSTAIPIWLPVLFPVVLFFFNCFNVKMKALQSCRMSWTTCLLTQCRIPQNLNLMWSDMFLVIQLEAADEASQLLVSQMDGQESDSDDELLRMWRVSCVY